MGEGKQQTDQVKAKTSPALCFCSPCENKLLSSQVSERQGKVRTYFISTMRSKTANAGTDGRVRGRTAGRMTLAGVVFGLVQARNKEKMRETNGGFSLAPCALQC